MLLRAINSGKLIANVSNTLLFIYEFRIRIKVHDEMVRTSKVGSSWVMLDELLINSYRSRRLTDERIEEKRQLTESILSK